MQDERLIPGKYWSIVVCGEGRKLNNAKGTPLISVTVTIGHFNTGPADAPVWEALPVAYQRRVDLFLTDAAWPYTEPKLKALGFNGDFAAPEFSGDAVTTGIALVCSHKTRDGKTYEDWDLADWGGGGDAEPLDKATVQLMNARWKTNQTMQAPPAGQPVGIGAPAPAPNPATVAAPEPDPTEPPPVEPPLGGEDIPF